MREQFEKNSQLAKEALAESHSDMKMHYDVKSANRHLNEGEQFLILLPMSSKALEAQWKGPYLVTEKLNDVDYMIRCGKGNNKDKRFHINMLKLWKSRKDIMSCEVIEDDEDGIVTYNSIQTETWKDCEISENLDMLQKQKLDTLLKKYEKLFSDKPGRTNITKFPIDTGDAKPIQQKPYQLAQSLKGPVEDEIETLLKQGVITESSSEWSSPIVVRRKLKDGKMVAVRMCIDFRKVNTVTKDDPFPLPRTEDLIENLANSKFITTLDLTKGYYQVPLEKTARPKTAFVTHKGKYEFTCLPFGTKNASGHFQKMVQKILRGCEEFSESFIDDIVIYSTTFENHLKHLEQVFHKLLNSGLTAKPSKCKIFHAQVPYLGHLVGHGTIRPLQAKVEVIQNYPRPETKKQVRSWLGLTGYYRKYIPNYSELAAPLTDLTKGKTKQCKVSWSESCEKSFVALKAALMTKPVLTLPDYNQKFVIQVDASERALGAILSQVNDKDDEHPICYASRKLLPREQSYSTSEKECLGIVWAITKMFKPYVFGRKFEVITDHNPLCWLRMVKDTNHKLLRWSLMLEEYDFEVLHKSGKYHTNADSLSRI